MPSAARTGFMDEIRRRTAKGLKFAIDSTRAYQLDEERAQKVLEVYDPLDPNAGPPKERREENRPKRPRRDDDDERNDRHHRHHR
ncbi:hypothetical protein FOZ60_001156 [Perkinsus olseni]|uniref:Uncharacterized protein n=1 Tax=Perkinsus olseni TaxID=32597 RepID=A0A7J6P113_PEROL|nr:hypothetical protein FOZ60_001156 [Perkinsus olseni]